MNLFSNRGSAIITVLIMGAVVLVGAFGVTTLVRQSVQMQKLNRVKNSAAIIKDNIFGTLNNSSAWAETIFHPSNNGVTNCLRTDGATCPAVLGVISVRQANKAVLINNNANEGFDYSGARCTNFDSVNGHQTCVFKFTITASCDAPCPPTRFPAGALVPITPNIRLTAVFDYRPRIGLEDYLRGQVNRTSSQYTFNFRRGTDSPGVEAFCATIGGTFDPVTTRCRSPNGTPDNFDCTALLGQQAWFIGFNPGDGSPNCVLDAKVNVNCGNDMGVTGILADGNFRCAGY